MSRNLLEIFARYKPSSDYAEILASADPETIQLRVDKPQRMIEASAAFPRIIPRRTLYAIEEEIRDSLSVVGGLILGDFAVSIGWLIPEVIVYMAFVSIANFSQRSYELGYAFKFMRILLVILIQCFNVVGFALGCAVVILLLLSNRTVNGKHSYLYPLFPFNFRAFLSLFVRLRKDCFPGNVSQSTKERKENEQS